MAKISKPEPKKQVNPQSPEEVQILPQDYTLKKKIGPGVDIRDILQPEIIEKSQELIGEGRPEFLEEVKIELASLDTAYQAAMENLSASDAGKHISELRRAAFSIKSKAGTFGFDLATAVAKSLYTFCDRHWRPEENHMTVLAKHIETLQVIFSQNIEGDGGEIGRNLLADMQKLVKKFV